MLCILGNGVPNTLSGNTDPSLWCTRLDSGERERHGSRGLPLFYLTYGDAYNLLITARLRLGIMIPPAKIFCRHNHPAVP
jgi:hypothetical protein